MKNLTIGKDFGDDIHQETDAWTQLAGEASQL